VPRYLIEVPHDSDTVECARVAHVFLSTGSHFLSNADWGCADGVHCAWIVIETSDKQEAARVVPPAFRSRARITRLVHFRIEKIEETLRRHGALPGQTPSGG
jgi:hypothetical protein